MSFSNLVLPLNLTLSALLGYFSSFDSAFWIQLKLLLVCRWRNHQEHKPAVWSSCGAAEEPTSLHRPQHPGFHHQRHRSADGSGPSAHRWQDRGMTLKRRTPYLTLKQNSRFMTMILEIEWGLCRLVSCRVQESLVTEVSASVLSPRAPPHIRSKSHTEPQLFLSGWMFLWKHHFLF